MPVNEKIEPSMLLLAPYTGACAGLALIGYQKGKDFVVNNYFIDGALAEKMGGNTGAVVMFGMLLQVGPNLLFIPAVERLNQAAHRLTEKMLRSVYLAIRNQLSRWLPNARVMPVGTEQMQGLAVEQPPAGANINLLWRPLRTEIPKIILARAGLFCLGAFPGLANSAFAVHQDFSAEGGIEDPAVQRKCDYVAVLCGFFAVFLMMVGFVFGQLTADDAPRNRIGR